MTIREQRARRLAAATGILLACALVACGNDVTVDGGADARVDMARTDAGTAADSGTDAAGDSGTDAAADSGTDAAVDAASGTDAAVDAASDSGTDAGADSGTDAGTDAGPDADAGDADGGTATGTILLAATGGATVLGGELLGATGVWSTTTLTDASDDAPAVALTGASSGVVVLRSRSAGGELRFATWTPGTFGAVTALAAGVTSRAAPHLAASGSVAALVFHGDDFKHYFGSWLTTWAPTAEAIGGSATQSFGPSPASMVATGSDAVVVFAGDDHDLYDQTRTGGAWGTASGHGLGSELVLTPAVVVPTSGPELAVVYVRESDSRILFTTRTAGVWTTPAAVDASALSGDPPSLAALAGGDLLVAWRGLDGRGYFSRLHASAWSAPAGIATPSPSVASAPSVAAGIDGNDAELAYVDASDGHVAHERLASGSWSRATDVGGAGMTFVTIATAP